MTVAKKKTSKKNSSRKSKKSSTGSSDSAEKSKKSSSKAAKNSESKSAERSGPSPEELENVLYEHVGGILILDEKSKIVYANEPAAQLLGKDAKKLLGVKVTKLKSFSEVTDQLTWLGQTCRLMLENTAERRLAKVKVELKKVQQELEASSQELEQSRDKREAEQAELAELAKELESSRKALSESNEELEASRKELAAGQAELKSSQEELAAALGRAEDADERAQEMEGFLEQMEVQHSELESRIEQVKDKGRKAQEEWEETEAGLFKRLARLESSLAEKTQELEETSRQKLETEMALEAARRECVILNHEVTQLQDSSSSQDSVLAQKVGTLQSLIMQADAKETGFLRKIADLETTLKETRDETTIAKYDLNEALEKLDATKQKLENAEGRVKDAADELFKAWEVAEAAQKQVKEADELREKAEKRTAELEEIFVKITPEDDDTIMAFL